MRAIKEHRILEFEVKLAMISNYKHILKACAYLVDFKRPFLKVKRFNSIKSTATYNDCRIVTTSWDKQFQFCVCFINLYTY